MNDDDKAVIVDMHTSEPDLTSFEGIRSAILAKVTQTSPETDVAPGSLAYRCAELLAGKLLPIILDGQMEEALKARGEKDAAN